MPAANRRLPRRLGGRLVRRSLLSVDLSFKTGFAPLCREFVSQETLAATLTVPMLWLPESDTRLSKSALLASSQGGPVP